MLQLWGTAMSIRKMQNQSGISLVEVIIGMAIMLIIMAPISNSLNASIKSYQYNMAQNQNITSTRDCLNTIADELRYATAISVLSSTGSTLPGTQISYTVGTQSRTIDTVIDTPATSNTLVIAYDGAVQKQIALSNLQSITFTRNTITREKLTISVQLNNASYANSPTMTSSTNVIMQNM